MSDMFYDLRCQMSEPECYIYIIGEDIHTASLIGQLPPVVKGRKYDSRRRRTILIDHQARAVPSVKSSRDIVCCMTVTPVHYIKFASLREKIQFSYHARLCVGGPCLESSYSGTPRQAHDAGSAQRRPQSHTP